MDIEIPYNVKERKDTGLYNSKLGMWLFLASEVMLFGALFSSYIIFNSIARNPRPQKKVNCYKMNPKN